MDISIELYQFMSRDVIRECEELAWKESVVNGGSLRMNGVVAKSEYLVCAKNSKGKIVGYVALKNEGRYNNALDIFQIVVSSEERNKGIATKMLRYIVKYSKGYDYIGSEVRKDNNAMNSLLGKLGYVRREKNEKVFFHVLDLRAIEGRKDLKAEKIIKR